MSAKESTLKPKKKFFTQKRLFFVVLFVIIAVGAILGVAYTRRASGAGEYLTANVERGDIRNTVNATGTAQAVTTVQVGAQITGLVRNLYADFNSVVHAGQIVARLDPSTFEAQVASAKAALGDTEARQASAEAALGNSKANVDSAKANLVSAQVMRDDAQRVLNRDKELQTAGVLTDRDLEAAQAGYEGAVAKYNQAAAQVAVAQAQVKSAEAAVVQSKADVQQSMATLKLAEVNLAYTVIKTPIDGVVVSRSVDVGQTVTASLSAPTLFTIANDLRHMQVMANIDEADIGKISDQVKVNFTVDAYPGRQFTGTISEIRLNSQTASNVVTYSVISEVDNSALLLKPGMTANIQLLVSEARDVVKVPNSALRFRPADKTQDDIKKILASATPAGGQGGNQPPAAGGPPAPDQAAGGQQGGRGGAQTGNTPAQGDGGQKPPPQINTAGLSPEAAAVAQKFRDPSLSREDKQALMAQLSDSDRQKLRESFQRQASNGGGAQADKGKGPGGDKGKSGPGGKNGRNGQPKGGGDASGAGSSNFNIPTQHSNYVASGIDPSAANKIKFPAVPVRRGPPTVIWVQTADKKIEPRVVQLGITDGQFTEVRSTDLKEGDIVVIGQTVAGSAAQPASNPFQQRPGGPGGAGGGGGRPPGR